MHLVNYCSLGSIPIHLSGLNRLDASAFLGVDLLLGGGERRCGQQFNNQHVKEADMDLFT